MAEEPSTRPAQIGIGWGKERMIENVKGVSAKLGVEGNDSRHRG